MKKPKQAARGKKPTVRKKKAGGSNGAMSFARFLELREKPTGRHCPALREHSQGLDVPLWFDRHEEVIDVVRGFSVRSDCFGLGYGGFAEGFAKLFPKYALIALVDSARAEEEDPRFNYDSYMEFFIAVDKTTARKEVHLWTAGKRFQKIYPSFEQFWASLDDGSAAAE